MGRPPWTTPEQAEFLRGFVDRLDEEKSGNGLNVFYASVAQQFIQQWPSPVPPDVDREKVTDPIVLKELSDKRRSEVSCISVTLPLSIFADS
jgi:hypothetical protein